MDQLHRLGVKKFHQSRMKQDLQKVPKGIILTRLTLTIMTTNLTRADKISTQNSNFPQNKAKTG